LSIRITICNKFTPKTRRGGTGEAGDWRLKVGGLRPKGQKTEDSPVEFAILFHAVKIQRRKPRLNTLRACFGIQRGKEGDGNYFSCFIPKYNVKDCKRS